KELLISREDTYDHRKFIAARKRAQKLNVPIRLVDSGSVHAPLLHTPSKSPEKAVFISREQATDATLYRVAKEKAIAENLPLMVTGEGTVSDPWLHSLVGVKAKPSQPIKPNKPFVDHREMIRCSSADRGRPAR